MYGDELFARLNGHIKAAAAAAVSPNLEFVPGDFALPQKTPVIHTAPTDFTYSASDTPGFAAMSVEQKVKRDPLGAVKGTFSVVFAGKDYAQCIELRDVAMAGVRAFIEDLKTRKPLVYAEIESIGRPDADLPDDTPFVREVLVSVEYRANKLWS